MNTSEVIGISQGKILMINSNALRNLESTKENMGKKHEEFIEKSTHGVAQV